MLISAYRAYGISHFVYSAVILMSCLGQHKAEMIAYQNRVLRIIGISQSIALTEHNILPIIERVDEICMRNFNRIICRADILDYDT